MRLFFWPTIKERLFMRPHRIEAGKLSHQQLMLSSSTKRNTEEYFQSASETFLASDDYDFWVIDEIQGHSPDGSVYLEYAPGWAAFGAVDSLSRRFGELDTVCVLAFKVPIVRWEIDGRSL